MKNLQKAISLAVLVIASGLLTSVTAVGESEVDSLLRLAPGTGNRIPSFAVYLSVEPCPLPAEAGPVRLKLSVAPKTPCDEMTIKIAKIERLEYLGEESWTFPATQGDTIVYYLDLVVPPNDTSGLEIQGILKKTGHRIRCHFITVNDTVCFFNGGIRWPQEPPADLPPRRQRGSISEEEWRAPKKIHRYSWLSQSRHC